MPDTAMTPIQQLLDLINNDNATNLTFNQVTLSLPEPASAFNRNTKVTVTAKPSSPYEGSQDFYYNRLALSQLGYIGVLSDEPISSAQLFSIVNEQYSINLLPDEFENIITPVLEVGDVGKITLRSKAQAIKWYGETEIEVIFSLPSNLEGFFEFLHVTLPLQVFAGQ